MNPRITINREESYVHSLVVGQLTLELLSELITQSTEKAGSWNLNNHLVDFRIAEKTLGITDDYNLANYKAREYGLKQDAKHAILIKPEDKVQYQFVETAFLNAGFVIKIFTEVEAAVEWIDDYA